MIPGLTDKVLARLVGIGRREAFGEFHQLLADFPHAWSGEIMRHPAQAWYDLARQTNSLPSKHLAVPANGVAWQNHRLTALVSPAEELRLGAGREKPNRAPNRMFPPEQ